MNIELSILEQSYWEHFKTAKDLSLIFPVENKRRKELEREMEKLLTRINKIKDEAKVN